LTAPFPTDDVIALRTPEQEVDTERLHPMTVESKTVFNGKIVSMTADTVDLGEAGVVYREYVSHPGAVAILALDAEDRVALVNQYRHPVHSVLWEIPAGLLDVAGESPHDAAMRELAEETDLTAQTWHVLVDFLTSPGGSNESLRVFLARDIGATSKHFARSDEELTMKVEWVKLDDLVAAILAGQVQNPSAVIGALAAKAARDSNWQTLRPVDAPWPHQPPGR
jgi:ADP-ribose pyrophosphatase